MNVLSLKAIHELKDYVLLSTLVVVEAVQALLIIVFFTGQIPVRSDLSQPSGLR